jgi:hypothetical protein
MFAAGRAWRRRPASPRATDPFSKRSTRGGLEVNPSPARTLRSGFAIYIPYELEPEIRRAPIENGRALQDLFY